MAEKCFRLREGNSSQDTNYGFPDFLEMDDSSNSLPLLESQADPAFDQTLNPNNLIFQYMEAEQYDAPHKAGYQHYYNPHQLKRGKYFSQDNSPELSATVKDKSRPMDKLREVYPSIHSKAVSNTHKYKGNGLEEPKQSITTSSTFRKIAPIDKLSGPHPSSSEEPVSRTQTRTFNCPPIDNSLEAPPRLTTMSQNKSQTNNSTSSASNNHPQDQTSQSCPSDPVCKHCKDIPKGKDVSMNGLPSDPNCQGLQNREDLLPSTALLLKDITKFNYEIFLVKLLKLCHHVSMADLYNLLYNDTHANFASVTTGPVTQNYSSSCSRQRELETWHRIVQSFKIPSFSSSQNIGHKTQPRVPFVKYHELLRNILAMKIISDTIIQPAYMHQVNISLSSASVHKMYYICCQKLVAKYPTVYNSLIMQKTIILGPAQLGKITRLVFPNLQVKRLGRRGQSKHHYMGLKWNEDIVDETTLNMLDLSRPTSKDALHDSGSRPNNAMRGQDFQVDLIQEKRKQEAIKAANNQLTMPRMDFTRVTQSPTKSFVDFHCRFPSLNCSPRIWKILPKLIPQQSKWAKDTMFRSVEILKRNNIDLTPLIQNFNSFVYSAYNPHCLSNTVTQALRMLYASSASSETYKHLYLTVTLLLFPVIISSDQEIAFPLKNYLRASVRNCIHIISAEFVHPSSGDKPHLEIFTGILEKMVKLNEMTSVLVRGASPGLVLKEVAKDVRTSGDLPFIEDSSLSSLAQSYLKLVMTTFKAYEFEEAGKSSQKSPPNETDASLNIAQNFATAVTIFADSMQSVSSPDKSGESKDVSPDIVYQIFSIGMDILHTKVLIDPSVGGLPIPIFSSMIAQILRYIHDSSFDQNRNRDSELSKEVFKSFWVYATMFHEYLCVISEVAALSQSLASGSELEVSD